MITVREEIGSPGVLLLKAFIFVLIHVGEVDKVKNLVCEYLLEKLLPHTQLQLDNGSETHGTAQRNIEHFYRHLSQIV